MTQPHQTRSTTEPTTRPTVVGAEADQFHDHEEPPEAHDVIDEVATPEVRVERMLPDQIRAAITTSSVVYLPLGSIEYHSHHLPLGLDGLTAHGVCARAALRTGGVVLPTLWWGTGGTHTTYPWTIMTASAIPLVELVETTITRLSQLGVELCVLFTGHFADEQLELVDEAAAVWNARGRGPRVLPLAVNRSDAPLDPDHAGTFETMLLHALEPDLVRIDRLPSLDQTPLDPAGEDGTYDHRHTPGHPLWGVMGPDPRPADLARSGALLGQVVDWTCRQVYRHDPCRPTGVARPGATSAAGPARAGEPVPPARARGRV